MKKEMQSLVGFLELWRQHVPYPRMLFQHTCQISGFLCRSRPWKVISFSFHWNQRSKELSSRCRLQFKQPPAFWTIYLKIYGICGPYDNRSFSGEKRHHVQFMAITCRRSIPFSHWILGHATCNKESHTIWEMVAGMLLSPVRDEMSDYGTPTQNCPWRTGHTRTTKS